MTSRVTTLSGLPASARQAARTAVLLVVVMVAVLAAGAFQESWALQRSWTVTTSLKDGAVHFLGDLNGELYFVNQFQLWKTNGTPAGTVLLTDAIPLVSFQEDICPLTSPHFARAGTANGLIFFSADDGVHGQELWRSDGTAAGTLMVKDLDPSGSSTPHDFVAVNGAVHFDTTGPCCGVWRSVGTEAGTSFLPDQRLPLGSLGGFYVFAKDGELWRSDGTSPGTVSLAVIDPAATSGATFLAKDTGKLYFTTAGPSLWVTDGTSAGTVPLLEPLGFSPAMTCDAGLCYFVETGFQGSTIWRIDGTPQGTIKITDLADSNASKPVVVNGTAYFTTFHEVWKTDGTPAGTAPIFSDPLVFASALTYSDGDFFFVVQSQGPQWHLWRSDGAPAGTRAVADLGTSVNAPNVVIVDGTLVVGVWGPVLNGGVVSTDVWQVRKFDRGAEQLVTLADLARNAVHCPTPLCSCNLAQPEQSAVVGRHWYFEALDPLTLTPKLEVVADVYFRDVTPDHWAFSWVEALADVGLTQGCGSDTYCADAAVSRAEMAVFLLRGIHGVGYQPPAATGLFTDVPTTPPAHPFANWIEQLAREAITLGCGASLYCPDAAVTRGEMAVFLLRSKHGAGYQPPDATGMFDDVPVMGPFAHPFAPWIEQLAREGITGGCATSPARYCPSAPVTRGQMAVFLVRAFNLPM